VGETHLTNDNNHWSANMAKSGAVWGIDVGQCALKALRCRATDADDKIEGDAFDYIEYPKILSQPDANPGELIRDALKQFLSRNSVKGDAVAISVSGQAGLARFIKLPPVEAKKIPDIVRYEAKQQIPFDLNDVIWDYQRLGVGTVEEGFALETEIGLFAMKRDEVFRRLEPFRDLGIEIDYVQLTPLTLYNYLVFDQLRDLPPPDEYDPDDPPESVVILSLGTESTDLVITNGYRVWQRSIPLGGNHFTKALTKEMKLTFAKAEHLKRNATAAADPKAVFQAMRPVFNDLLTELQRSINFFSNLDRSAKIGRFMALGNAMKLPGLRKYLSQSLGFEIERVESYNGLTGSPVVASPIFQENALCFGVCYGLVLQGLAKSGIRTNLLPPEIVKSRLVKQKKPWAVAAAAALLLGCGVSYGAYSLGMNTVDDGVWKTADAEAKKVISRSDDLNSKKTAAKTSYDDIKAIGDRLVGKVEGRLSWLELFKAIDAVLPTEDDPTKERPEDVTLRKELYITNIESQYVEDVAPWVTGVSNEYHGPNGAKQPAAGEAPAPVAPAAPAAPATPAPGLNTGMGMSGPAGAQPAGLSAPAPTATPTPAASGGDATAAPTGGPTGKGYIIKIEGYHYHNNKSFKMDERGEEYLRKTLIDGLENGKVSLPTADRKGTEMVTMKELGISYPVLWKPQKVEEELIENPKAGASAHANPAAGGSALPGGGTGQPERILVPKFKFTVMFCWQPKLPHERLAAKEQAKAAAAPETAQTTP
jgi:type IV pilus assembly protein PilM